MVAAIAASAAACMPIPGSETVFTAERRWVIVGELHGTNETPAAFANLACLAGEARRPVIVALEYPSDLQPMFDAWLASDGGAAAKAALLATPIWHRHLQDGRTSVAFLRLFEELRQLKRAGRIASMRGFDMPSDGSERGDRNAYMAARLRQIADESRGLVLALVGNYHAIRVSLPRPDGGVTRPAASLLPDGERYSLNVTGDGGAAWNCQADGCRAHDMGAARPSVPAAIIPEQGVERRYDATYALGMPFSAAAPAVPGAATHARRVRSS